MKKFLVLPLILISFCLTDVSGMARKSDYSNERVRQGVHGTYSALNLNRVDIADQIISETVRIVPPPKKPLNIKEMSKTVKDKSTGQSTITKYIVLPAKMDGTVIKKDSPEFQELIKDRELLKAYQESEKTWIKYGEEVGEAMRRNAQKIDDLGKEIEKKQEIIVKKEKKITELSKYKSIVFSVVALIGLLIGVYILSLFIRLALAGARIFS